ncbi:hypothetical protein L226DRAFT_386103 [Lentinus tigrinus ALCF2SS1-7]|uniref:uncharacterized protein n=1 Tax=Lentinus tigrinus ALCF2SS1-7 TaxID=1328758 RepID=UPI001165D7D1|nr:hypothetical protein L226DRAFT_386103 [Lentinus tigrinus ALCF2SS1-7]
MRSPLCKVQPDLVLARFVRCLHWTPRRRDEACSRSSIDAGQAVTQAQDAVPCPLLNDSFFPRESGVLPWMLASTTHNPELGRTRPLFGLARPTSSPGRYPDSAIKSGLNVLSSTRSAAPSTVRVGVWYTYVVHLCLARSKASIGTYTPYHGKTRTHVIS